MSNEEQDAILGGAMREVATLRRELQAIEIKLDGYVATLASWSEHIKAQVRPGYTPRDPRSDQDLPSSAEVNGLLVELDSIRDRLARRESQLREAG